MTASDPDTPLHAERGASHAERGALHAERGALHAERGASRIGRVAIVLAVLGLVGVVVAMPTREGLLAQYVEATERLLSQGPGVGRWRIEDGFGAARFRAIAPWPADERRLLVGRVESGLPGDAPIDFATASARRVRTFSRERLVTYVTDAPGRLFFQNYVPAGPPTSAKAEDGSPALRLDWVPRHSLGGDTSRRVWHDRNTFEVVQVEDRSYHGRLLHGLYRVSKDPGPMDAPESASERHGSSEGRGPGTGGGAWRPRAPTEAHFVVLAPTYLPPGFEQTGAWYHEWPIPGPRGERGERGEREKGERKKMRVAMYTYSDGLAFLSVHVAPREDMDAMQAFAARRDEHRSPEACPSLPEVAGDIAEGTLVIRRRADLCRTVLRVDDVEGSSVSVIGRNEVPGDEYIRVIRSLARVTADAP